MGPERDVVPGILLVAEDDDVDQGHGIDVRVAQQGVAGIQHHLVADAVPRTLQHGKIEIRLELRADVQRYRLDAAGHQAVARLLDPVLQGQGGHTLHAVVDGLWIAGGGRHAEAAATQADRLLAGRAGGLRPDGCGKQRQRQQRKAEKRSERHGLVSTARAMRAPGAAHYSGGPGAREEGAQITGSAALTTRRASPSYGSRLICSSQLSVRSPSTLS